jgi:diguanylate cyclase (GGDEF)-like protein
MQQNRLSSAVGWYHARTRAQRDLIVIALVAIPTYLVLLAFDAFDLVYDWTRLHEDWQLDELVALLFTLGLAAIVYSWRRLSDLRGEISRRRDAEEEANRLARYDVLTGLANRRLFLEEARDRFRNLPKGCCCALFVVDLDQFKPINDFYGHRLGDEVLRVVADRLTRLVDGEGIVARLGGDEFGILLPYRRNDDKAERLARRIINDLPRPIALAALSLEIGVSIGIAVYDPADRRMNELAQREGNPVETVLRQADMAMYRAKTSGRGLYRFFDRDMDEALQQRVHLEREIKGAITRGEIVPYYQPLVDLATRETVGYEILARWLHPARGLLMPELFIPIAEDTGAIGDLTYYLLARAVRDAKDRSPHTFLSLNLSPRQFADPELAERILSILTEAGFPPQRLEIEITETAIVQRLEDAKVTLQSLRNLGIRIALDDFGTGYAGLHHLRELKLDTLKIDRSFITHMLDNPDEAKIVEAIVSLGHSFGLRTTAEGIETREVLDRLMQLGCETGQGFLFGKPVAVAVPGDELSDERQIA